MSYVPRAQEGLLLRSPLTQGFIPPSSFYQHKPIYTKECDKTHMLEYRDQQILAKRNVGNLAFYTRNNPHPNRVRHMKGLLDIPICSVEDQVEPRYLLSPPSGQDYGTKFYTKGSTRYSANTNKGRPAVGVVPVTYAWKDELEQKTQNAITKAMGQSPPSRGGGVKKENFDDIQDDKVLELLCRILQTDSISACQAWLSSATESEKTIVLNMIKMVACGELQDPTQPNTPSKHPHNNNSPKHDVWIPSKSHPKETRRDTASSSEDTIYLRKRDDDDMGGLCEMKVPLKYTMKNDIVREVQRLSRQASRDSMRPSSSSVGMTNRMGKDEKVNTLARKLAATGREKEQQRRRSNSMIIPTSSASGKRKSANTPIHRAASRSVPTGGPSGDLEYPPPPVNISVTKERLCDGESARMRYTSHWNSNDKK